MRGCDKSSVFDDLGMRTWLAQYYWFLVMLKEFKLIFYSLITMPLWMKVSAKCLKWNCKPKSHSSQNKRADPEPYAIAQETLLHVKQQMCLREKVKEGILFI